MVHSPNGRGQARFGHPVHQPLVLEPVRHDLRHRDERDAVLGGQLFQLRAARHGAVFAEDFADHAGRLESRQPRQVHAGLGLAHALQHAAGPGLEGEHVAGPPQVGRHGLGVDGHLDGGGAVGRADAGGHAEALGRVHAHREGGVLAFGVLLHHLRQVERAAALGCQRQADQPAAVLGHEVDERGRDELGRGDEVSLVLAVLVVGHDDQLAGADVLDRLPDGAERHRALRRRGARWTA